MVTDEYETTNHLRTLWTREARKIGVLASFLLNISNEICYIMLCMLE